MKEKLDAWTVDTVDLTARVAAAIGAMPLSPEGELIGELRALRREDAELREAAAMLRALLESTGSRCIAPSMMSAIIASGAAAGSKRPSFT